MVIEREMRFSQRFSNEFKVPFEKILPFFQNEFQLCLVGKADLKEELKKYLPEWNWRGSADELLEYWFGHEKNVSPKMLDSVKTFRDSGIKCFICTQNEKYIVDYVLKNIGLEKYFDGVFSTNQIGFLKSDSRFWQSIWQQLDSPDKKSILCWDDNKDFAETAKKFGFETELYTGFNEYKNKINYYLSKK
jgi:FMN phosphatase YigB (HAD superfamily)